MIAVIFEVRPADDTARQVYIDLAGRLRPDLERLEDFLSVERFESLSDPGKILSLSFWQDEKAVSRWRNLEAHRAAQAEGRAGLFANYRLRIAEVVRDYGLRDRDEAPPDSRAANG